jgi:hypothetical protein
MRTQLDPPPGLAAQVLVRHAGHEIAFVKGESTIAEAAEPGKWNR